MPLCLQPGQVNGSGSVEERVGFITNEPPVATPTARAEDQCSWVASIGPPIGAVLVGWKIDRPPQELSELNQ